MSWGVRIATKRGLTTMNNFEFGKKMKARTKAFAVQIVTFYKLLPKQLPTLKLPNSKTHELFSLG
jgi:hypothetical protein